MDGPSPRFTVAAEWPSRSGLITAQVVEVNELLPRLLLGGLAIRVRLADQEDETSCAFTMSAESATELRDLIGQAIDRRAALAAEKQG